MALSPWVLWKSRGHSGMTLRTPGTEPAAPGAFLGIRPWAGWGWGAPLSDLGRAQQPNPAHSRLSFIPQMPFRRRSGNVSSNAWVLSTFSAERLSLQDPQGAGGRQRAEPGKLQGRWGRGLESCAGLRARGWTAAGGQRGTWQRHVFGPKPVLFRLGVNQRKPPGSGVQEKQARSGLLLPAQSRV